MADLRSIEALLEPSLNALGFRLIRVSFGTGSRPVLQVMAEPLDGSGMTVEHCSRISRTVSALLDVEDPIPGAYMLEVTSPGIDRPLITRDDFDRFAGFEARIELARAVDGRRRFRGRLMPIDEQGMVTIAEPTGEARLPFDAIHKAKLVLTDDLIAATEAARPSPPEGEA